MDEKSNKNQIEFILDALKAPLIAILVFFCFEHQITDWLWAFNAKWMSRCNEIIGGILIVALLLLLMWQLYDKWLKTKLSVSHVGWLLCFVAVYVYYRIFDQTFYFWGFSIGEYHIAYMDFILAPLIQLAIIQYKIRKNKIDARLEGLCIIDKDEPIEIEDEDLFGYGNLIRSLLSDLSVMNLSRHSYSVGIAGEWGIGKSSFFNLFKRILNEKEYKEQSIIVEFNPRTCTNIKDIQQEFFDLFASALAKYHSGIARDMRRYQDALQLPESDFVVKLMRLLPSLTVSKSRGVINDVIKEIGRRVYVFIDDFDRLTAEEILEVMKVIDRNGDFRQTIFITAYDKEYVNNVLKNYLKYRKKDAFTDKYFNYELPLPVQTKSVLTDYVKNSLGEKLQEETGDAISVKQMQDEWLKIASPIAEQLRTLRHCKRFMNIFLARYSRVRNDVMFGDFMRVSLLRYYDINCYNALAEGKFTKGGGILTSNTNSVLYRVDQIEEKLNKYAKWEGSKEVLFELINESQDGDYEQTSKYKRLQFVKSFPCYFYDYQPNGVYHSQLIELYDAKTEGNAIECIHKLIKYNKEKKEYDQASYVAVENFLRVRPVSDLHSGDDVMRMFSLLTYLNGFVGRSINIEASLFYMMGTEFAKTLNQHGIISVQEYKERLEENIKHQMEMRPLSIAFVIHQVYDAMRKQDTFLNDYLFSKDEIQMLAEWCQKYYLSKIETITPYNAEAVVSLSRVFEAKDNGEDKISDSAKREFLAFISLHAEDFVKSVVNVVKTQPGPPKLLVRIEGFFVPSEFFPCDGVDLAYWIRNEVNSLYLSYLFERLLKENKRSIQIELQPGDHGVNVEDYAQVYAVVKEYDDLADEKKVLNAMKKQVANSIELLSKQTSVTKENVKAAITRMKQKGELTDQQANIAETIPAFKKGDYVRMKDKDKVGTPISINHVVNLFEIKEIKGKKLRLIDVDTEVNLDDIEAVPIDGVHDKKVYYDPIVAASIIPPGGSIPVHNRDYSYFMEKFENCLDVDKRSYADIVRERNYHFVHEVQQWLREEGDDGLKIYVLGY